MRSSTPKVLHELCGLPMVLWPVRAAQRAGAGRIIVIDSPERALRDVLPEGVQIAVQESPDGTGGAAAAGMAMLEQQARADAGETVVVLSGDVPLVSAEAIEGLIEAHRAAGAQATMATTLLDDPSGYGRVVRDEHGEVQRVVETKTQGDSTQAEREIREVNTGIFAFSAQALAAALPRLGTDNAQGERYLPQVLDLLRKLQSEYGLAMLFISHDLAVVGQVASRVAVMRAGQVVETGPCRQLLTNPEHPYTRSLLAAVPTLRTDRDRPLAMIV